MHQCHYAGYGYYRIDKGGLLAQADRLMFETMATSCDVAETFIGRKKRHIAEAIRHGDMALLRKAPIGLTPCAGPFLRKFVIYVENLDDNNLGRRTLS